MGGTSRGDTQAEKFKTMVLAKVRSEEHTSEIQSRHVISPAVFCLTKKQVVPCRTKSSAS